MAGYTNNDPVPTWFNEIVSERDLLSQLGSHPVFLSSVSALNNQPAVDFHSSRYFKTGGTWNNGNIAVPHSRVVVFKSPTSTQTNTAIVAGYEATAYQLLRMVAPATSKWAIYNGGAVTNSTGSTDANPHFAVMFFAASGGTSVLELEGATQVSATAATIGLHESRGSCMGAIFNGNTPWTGQIAFDGIYAGDVRTDPAYAALKTWAASTYGLTIA